jgi:hypothetical protein
LPLQIRNQYSAWLRKKGDDHVPGVEECEIMAKEFADFSDELRSVVTAQMGIIWVCS